jgi:hypothetical protein
MAYMIDLLRGGMWCAAGHEEDDAASTAPARTSTSPSEDDRESFTRRARESHGPAITKSTNARTLGTGGGRDEYRDAG